MGWSSNAATRPARPIGRSSQSCRISLGFRRQPRSIQVQGSMDSTSKLDVLSAGRSALMGTALRRGVLSNSQRRLRMRLNPSPASASTASRPKEDTSIDIQWGASTNASGSEYQAELSTISAMGVATQTVIVTSLSANFTGLSPATTYYARVKTLGWAGADSIYLIIGSTITAFSAPTQLSFSQVGTSSVTFNWVAATAPNIEFVSELTIGGFGSVMTDTTSVTNATFTALSVNTQYFARVETLDTSSGETSSWAGPISTFTLANPPVSLATTSVTSTSVGLSWSDGGNPSGTLYGVERSTDGVVFTEINNVSATSDTDSTALGGIT